MSKPIFPPDSRFGEWLENRFVDAVFFLCPVIEVVGWTLVRLHIIKRPSWAR